MTGVAQLAIGSWVEMSHGGVIFWERESRTDVGEVEG